MPKKATKPKKSRSAAEQAAIDKRMAAMRASRQNKIAAKKSSLSPAAIAAPAKPANTAPTVAPQTPPSQVILEWRIRQVSDFASIPQVHIQKALHFFDRAVRKSQMENQAVEEFIFTEQGSVRVKTVAVDPLS